MSRPGLVPSPPEEPWFSSWDLLPAFAACLLLALVNHAWPHLQDPLPTHFAADGRANGWTPKAAIPWILFGFPGLIWLLIGVLGRATAPKDSDRRRMQLRVLTPVRAFLVSGFLLLMSLPVLVALKGPQVFLPVLAAFLLLVFAGVGAAVRRLYVHAPPEVRRYWKWGLFYVNPDDRRLWVPKLSGMGWTLNFARPAAGPIMLLILLIPVAVLVVARLLAR